MEWIGVQVEWRLGSNVKALNQKRASIEKKMNVWCVLTSIQNVVQNEVKHAKTNVIQIG